MNVNQTTKRPLRLDWKKLLVLGAILAIGGYQWYTGNLAVDDPVVVTEPGDKELNQRAHPDLESNPSSNADNGNQRQPKSLDGEFLLPAGGNRLKSPGGLIYTGGRSGHRSEHVLRHAHDIPNRDGPHGVFDADGDDVFRLIDEAYGLVKGNSSQVKSTPEGDGKTEYVVDMERRIGFLGGKTGARKNHPALSKIKLILGDNRVVTAYPF